MNRLFLAALLTATAFPAAAEVAKPADCSIRGM